MSQSDYTEYILRFSYGKDSFKCLDVIHTRGLPLDRITTTDVWATDTIPAWLPPMTAFKDRMDEWIWSKYRLEVEHLCARNPDGSKRTYEQMFYHIPNRRSQDVQVEREKKKKRLPQGAIHGFPVYGVPWCQSALKRNSKPQDTGNHHRIPNINQPWDMVPAAQNYLKEASRDGLCPTESSLGVKNSNTGTPTGFPNERPREAQKTNIVEYLGIAADEPDRFGQLNEKKQAPLVKFGIEEPLCGLYCQYAGCLAPTYETSCRDGCWFCHNQGVDQLRSLRRNYPEYWALMLKWDLDSPVTFKADGHTVHDFDRRFQMEDDGVVPIDNTFRWEPINSGWVSMFDLLRNEGYE